MSESIHALSAEVRTHSGRAENGLSAPAELIDSEGVRTIAERVAAVARLGNRTRILIAGCRKGDGASSVAEALALDLSRRLAVDTILGDADQNGGGRTALPAAQTKAGGNGCPVRVDATGVPRLWIAHCALVNNQPPAEPGLRAGAPLRSNQDGTLDELEQVLERYQAAVIDLGVVRLDARMLAVARPQDPILLVARYGYTRRDELAATAAILNLLKCKIGGVILNAYESPAVDGLRRIFRIRGQDR